MAHVLLKSYSNGITVIMDSDTDFEEIRQEVGEQFYQASKFFKNAKVALAFEGRDLTSEEETMLVDTITQHSDLKVLYIVGKDERYAHTFLKACEDFAKENENSNARVIRGNVINNECIESNNTIVIIGDVYPGCKIKSREDIIVLGGLYGEAYAGTDGNSRRFVAASEMNPEILMIGDLLLNRKPHKWGFKPKYQMQVAYVNYGIVKCDPITTEVFKSI